MADAEPRQAGVARIGRAQLVGGVDDPPARVDDPAPLPGVPQGGGDLGEDRIIRKRVGHIVVHGATLSPAT